MNKPAATAILVMTVLASTIIATAPLTAHAYPAAGTDTFMSTAVIQVEMIGGPPLPAIILTGPTTVMRGTPVTPPGGLTEIPTELVSLSLTGASPLGPVMVTQNATMPSIGKIKQQTPGVDFPANSFFDVFFELNVGGMVLHNNKPVNMSAVINSIPPAPGTQYKNPFATPPLVTLYDPTGTARFDILAEYHIVGIVPCFFYTMNGLPVPPLTPFCNPNANDIKIDFIPGPSTQCFIQWTQDGRIAGQQPCPPGANDIEVFWTFSKTGVPAITKCSWTFNEMPLPAKKFPCTVPPGANDFEFFAGGITQVFWTHKGKLILPPIPAPPGTNDVEFFF